MTSRQPNGEDLVSSKNSNTWIFYDYSLLEDIPIPGVDLPTLDPSAPIWSSHSLNCSNPVRVRSGTCTASNNKACREKMRRDRLNDRFLELGSVLDPGRPAKVDKAVILVDTVRMVTQLRYEAQKLRESNESLQEKINELKAEKNELRDEKQRLKTEKENLERQVKALVSQPGFLPHPPPLPTPYATPGQVVGSKLVPFLGYPRVSMWKFLPPAATSQDHILHPPVA